MSDNVPILADKVLPNRISIIPLESRPIFPGIFTPLMITDKADLEVVEHALDTTKLIGLVMIKEEGTPEMPPELYSVGTAARIVKKINLPDGGLNLFVSTLLRFRIKKVLGDGSRRDVAVEYLEDIPDTKHPQEIKALTRSIFSEMKALSDNNPLFSEEMRLNMVNIDHPGKLADFVVSILNVPREQMQEVLETLEVRARMEKVLIHIKREAELLKIQKKISRQINDKIEKNQREFFLREELKAIQKELGLAPDAKGSDYQKFKEKIEGPSFRCCPDRQIFLR